MNLIFDIDDTLYDQLQPFYLSCKTIIPNLTARTAEQLFVLSRKYSDQWFEQVRKGRISYKEMQRNRLIQAFKEKNINIMIRQADLIQKNYLNQQKRIDLLPQIRELFNEASRNKLKMGVITNGSSQHQRMKIKQLNLQKWINEENMLVSDDVGCAKPNPAIFKILEQRMQLNRSETYYIGDSFENDVMGAKSAGWKSIWLNHRHHKGKNVYIPDYVIHHVNDLLPLIKKLVFLREA
jgi:putative hydrolase of the HAD superfamily